MQQRGLQSRLSVLLVMGMLVLVGCRQVSVTGQVDAPALAVSEIDAGGEDRAPLTCRQLGGGYEYERLAGGVVGLGLRDPVADEEARAAAVQAREANGWDQELYDVLWNVGRSYEVASRAGFSRTPDEFEDLSRRALALLAQMPTCDRS